MSDKKEDMESPDAKKTLPVGIWAALIGLFGVLITGFFSVINTRTVIALPAQLTQTAKSALATMPNSTATETPVLGSKVYFVLPKPDELSMLPRIFAGYDQPETPTINSNSVEIHANESYIWRYHWCATSRERLVGNLKEMNFYFLVDGTPISQDFFLEYEIDTEKWICQSWAMR